MRRASALIMALWVIAVLSVMALSFATEAKLQSGVNVYVRERNRVNRLVEAGRVLGEVVMIGFKDVADYSEGEDLEKILAEDDRWYLEKRALKSDSRCTIGPIVLDRDDPDSGMVTVEIELVNAGEKNALNVNQLWQDGDQNYRVRWELIFRNVCGIPEDFEVQVKDEGRYKLTDLLIASWNDWRDPDETVTAIDGNGCGAEADWYEEHYEDDRVDDEDKRYPRNGQIPDIKELGSIRGWRDYPAVLTGGILNPDEKDKEDQIRVKGIVNLLGTVGSSKVNVNNCTVEQLLTVPGIGSEDEDDDEESRELAQAIVDTLKIAPRHRDDFEEGREWWPYKDWNDLTQRLADEADVDIGSEANEYLSYVPDENSVFKVRITGESMGMSHSVAAEAYVKEGKVRYIKWREDDERSSDGRQ